MSATAEEMTKTEAPVPDEAYATPVAFTAGAAQKVRELLQEEGNDSLSLRIYVSGGGCSGFQYGFAFDGDINADDTRIEDQGLRVLIDPMSIQYLMGAEVDFEDGLEGSRFVIKNPNATTTCGCGSSFSV